MASGYCGESSKESELDEINHDSTSTAQMKGLMF